MQYFVYRNFTSENLFQGLDIQFSGYNDISETPIVNKYIWFYLPEIKIKTDDIVEEINSYSGKLSLLLNQLPEDKTVLVFTIVPLFFIDYQNSDFRVNEAISEYNLFLYETSRKRKNFKVIEFSDFAKIIDTPILDWKYYYLSQSIISPRHNAKFKNWFESRFSGSLG